MAGAICLLSARLVLSSAAVSADLAGDAPRVVPTPALTEALALGRAHTGASATWMATVLAFSGDDRVDPNWVAAAVTTAGTLDPAWRTPWVYGSLMLVSLGDLPGHRALLAEAARRHPADTWFPTALAMSHQLDGGDPESARRWMRWAAEIPGADPLLHQILARWEAR